MPTIPAEGRSEAIPLPHGLPATGRLIAFVIGIENYQERKEGRLSKVDFAKNDAEAFADALRAVYPADRTDVQLLVDSGASLGNIEYSLQQTIASLEEDDLFVFYYAGHGYHGAGGNRITAWDSHAHGVEGTTLLLSEVLIEPLARSQCTRALAFVDACGSPIPTSGTRDVLSQMNVAELNAFLGAATYSALYLACEPGQKSYPSAEFKHGVWTHFLLKALRGEDDAALGEGRYLTDASLRDYLRKVVPRYITHRLTVKGLQQPTALVSASNTFAIRHVPEPQVTADPDGDLTRVGVVVKQQFFEQTETGDVKALPGFLKGRHFIPDRRTDQTEGFVVGLLADQIHEEVQALYETTKSVLGLRKKDVSRESDDGQGSLDTEVFRYWIESRQKADDPSQYAIVRRLELREGGGAQLQKLDEIFGAAFDRIVVKFEEVALDFDELVEFFEDTRAVHGGDLKDDEREQCLTYTPPGGPTLRFDLKRRRLVVSVGGASRPSTVLTKARKYRIGSSAPSQLLL